MIHPNNVKNYQGTLDELASEISLLEKEQQIKLIHNLALDIKEQSKADYKRARPKLSKNLAKSSEHIENAKKIMQNINFLDDAQTISKIQNYDDLESLAKNIGIMTYNSMSLLLDSLSNIYKRRSHAFYENKELDNYFMLSKICNEIDYSISYMNRAWEIALPYMKY